MNVNEPQRQRGEVRLQDQLESNICFEPNTQEEMRENLSVRIIWPASSPFFNFLKIEMSAKGSGEIKGEWSTMAVVPNDVTGRGDKTRAWDNQNRGVVLQKLFYT